MTTLEKAARAIKVGRGCDVADIHCGFCLWGPDERTKEWDETGCIWLARAAIEALKNLEPIEQFSIMTGELHCSGLLKLGAAHRGWNAMLDAILNEKSDA